MPSARLRAVFAVCSPRRRLAPASRATCTLLYPSTHSYYRVPRAVPAGKSAVGLLSYLACAAKCQPVVYIPRAGDWVTAAKAGKGDAFFLRTLLRQNAGECVWLQRCCRRGVVLLFALTAESRARKRIYTNTARLHYLAPAPQISFWATLP